VWSNSIRGALLLPLVCTRYLPLAWWIRSFSGHDLLQNEGNLQETVCCAPNYSISVQRCTVYGPEANAITRITVSVREVSLFESASNTYPPGLVTSRSRRLWRF